MLRAAARESVDQMLANMKRRHNAERLAEMRRLLATAPSPPPNPRAFYSNDREIRRLLATAPKPPPVPRRTPSRGSLNNTMRAMQVQLQLRQRERQRALAAKLLAIRAAQAARKKSRW